MWSRLPGTWDPPASASSQVPDYSCGPPCLTYDLIFEKIFKLYCALQDVVALLLTTTTKGPMPGAN
jgi:hypothetical protein